MLRRAHCLAAVLIAGSLTGLAAPVRAQSVVFASGGIGIALPAGPALHLAVGADLGRVRTGLLMTQTYRVVRSSPGLFGPPRQSRTMNAFLAHVGRVHAIGSDRRALVAGLGAARVKHVDRNAPAGTPTVRVRWAQALGLGAETRARVFRNRDVSAGMHGVVSRPASTGLVTLGLVHVFDAR